MNKTYYEKYLPKQKTLFEICQVKDNSVSQKRLKNASTLQILDIFQA